MTESDGGPFASGAGERVTESERRLVPRLPQPPPSPGRGVIHRLPLNSPGQALQEFAEAAFFLVEGVLGEDVVPGLAHCSHRFGRALGETDQGGDVVGCRLVLDEDAVFAEPAVGTVPTYVGRDQQGPGGERFEPREVEPLLLVGTGQEDVGPVIELA